VPPHPSDDLRRLLDEQLRLLPDTYRAPIVLCDLEGKTHKEAAELLGWPVGTLSGRLARARARLARRLVRLGLLPSVPALAVVLSADAALACVPASVAASAARLACLFAGGQAPPGVIPTSVAALAEGVLHTMLATKLKTVTALLLGLTLLAAGAGRLTGFAPEPGPDAAASRDHADIARLIGRLGSTKFREREAAAQALEAVGEPALDALRRAAASAPDLETQRRAERLVARIERRWELRCFIGHTDAVPGAALSPDGRLALSAGRSESSPRLWDVATGKELRRAGRHSSWVWDVAFTLDGKRALSCGVDGIRLWEVESGKELRRLTGHERQVYRVALSRDGKLALSGSQDNTIRLWDLGTGGELCCFSGHTDEVFSVAFSPDGRQALSCSADGTMRLWNSRSGKELRRLPGAACAVFSPNGTQLLSAGRDGLVRLWDVQTGKELRRFKGHTQEACTVAYSPDGKRVLSGSEDRTVRLWEVRTGKELRCLRGHTAGVSRVAFTPDGARALSASYDGTLRLWALPK
jgi:hypothetical protein